MDYNIITYLACICFIFIINIIGTGFGFHIGLNLFTSATIRTPRYTRYCLSYNNKDINRIKKI